MKIMQGDEYNVSLVLKDQDGETITSTGIADVEVVIGNLTKSFADGSVTYDAEAGAWIFHLTQQETYAFRDSLAFQVRVKLTNNDVVGTTLPSIFVTPSRSAEVL